MAITGAYRKPEQQAGTADAGGPVQLRLASRSLTPCSPFCVFQVDTQPGTDYVAFATSDGCIVIQQAVSAPPSNDVASAALSVLSPTQQHEAAPNSPALGQFISSCILDDQSAHRGARPVYQRVAWGGGPAYLLCAASDHHLHFFCLRHFFVKDAPGLTWAAQQAAAAAALNYIQPDAGQAASYPTTPLHAFPQPDTPLGHISSLSSVLPTPAVAATASGTSVPVPVTCCPLVASHRLDHPLLCLDWTQNTSGVLLTDTSNNVTMLGVIWQALDSVHIVQGGLPQVTVYTAWTACSDSTQPMAAAGWSPATPSATSHSRSNVGDSGMQHRVLIWWPRAPPSASAHPRTQEPAQGSKLAPTQQSASSAAPVVAGFSDAHDVSVRGYVVGTEVIRHPVKVVDMQWSPPLWQPPLRHTVSNPATLLQCGPGSVASPARKVVGSPGAAGPKVGSAAPVVGAHGAGQQRAAASASGATPAAKADAPEGSTQEQLALMTVGADWAVRIWVEVQMKDLLPAHLTLSSDPLVAAAAAATLSMSQFCLALVVESPIPPPATGPSLGMCVSWARPLALGTERSEAGGQPPTDSFMPQSPVRPTTATTATTVSSLPSPTASAASTAATARTAAILPPGMSHAAITIASRVQWLMATVSVPATSAGRPAGHHGTAELQETVFVWAVDGLHAADGGGLPRPAPSVQQKGGAGPRAVLWGRQSSQLLSWLQPQPLLQHAKDSKVHSQAFVLYPRGLPVFHMTEWWQPGMAGAVQQAVSDPAGGGEVRTLVVAAVSQDAGHTACPHTGVVLEAVCHQPLPVARAELRQLVPCDTVPEIAAALHKDGCVSFWWLDPVEELPLVSAHASSPHHTAGQRVLAAQLAQLADPCALSGMFGPVTALTWLHLSASIRPPAKRQLSGSAVARDLGLTSVSKVVTSPGPATADATPAYLACTVAGTVYVYALHLPNLPLLQPGGSSASSWGVQLVTEVARLQLPGSYLHVTDLLPVAPNQLMALVTGPSPRHSESGAADQGTMHAAGVGAHGVVLWHLAQRADVAGQHAGAHTMHEHEHLCASEPVVIPIHQLMTPSPRVDMLSVHSMEPDVQHVITCVSMPDPQSHMCMTGSSNGLVLFWKWGGEGDNDSSARSLQVTHSCWCDVPVSLAVPNFVSPDPSPRPFSPTQTEQAATDDQARLDTTYRCLPVSVALQQALGLAAAATTCGPAGFEDALFIWRRTTSLSSVSKQRGTSPTAAHALSTHTAAFNSSSSRDAVKQQDRDKTQQGVLLQDSWQLEAVVVLRDTVSCLAWLPSVNSMTALLVVGYASGLVEYHASNRQGSWQLVAEFRVGEESSGINSLVARMDGSLAMAAGCHVQVLSNVMGAPASASTMLLRTPAAVGYGFTARHASEHVLAHAASSRLTGGLSWPAGLTTKPKGTADDVAAMETVGQLLMHLCGPLPLHHPSALSTLLQCGQAALACKLLRSLLAWLQHAVTHMEQADLEDDSEDVGGSILAPSAAAQSPVSPVAATLPLPPPPTLSLEQLLPVATIDSAAVQALKQLAIAPPAPPPVHSSATAPVTTGAGNNDGAGSGKVSQLLSSKPAQAAQPPLVGSQTPPEALGSALAPAAKAQDGLHTGMLDLAAFGSFGDFGNHAQAEPEPKASQPAAVQDGLHSGLLDMSAFGGFEGTTAESAVPASAAAKPAQNSGLETGMLDMSAFGGFAPEGPSEPETPATKAASSVSTNGPFSSSTRDDPHMSLATGMLDMSTFGMALGNTAASPAPSPQLPSDDADMPLALLRQKRAATGTTQPATTAIAVVNAVSSGVAAEERKAAAMQAGAAIDGSATATQSVDMVLFPRVLPTPTTTAPAQVPGAFTGPNNAQDRLPACLLNQQEASALQLLLGVDLQQCIDDRVAMLQGGAKRDLPSSPLLPSYLQEEDGTAAATARAAHLRGLLRLNTQEALQLVLIARALMYTSHTDLQAAASAMEGLGAVFGAGSLQPSSSVLRMQTPQLGSPPGPLPTVFSGVFTTSTYGAANGVSSNADSQNGADVMDGLDAPAQAFLLAARLAAADHALETSGRFASTTAADDGAAAGKLGRPRSGNTLPSGGPTTPMPSFNQLFRGNPLQGLGAKDVPTSASPTKPLSLHARLRSASNTGAFQGKHSRAPSSVSEKTTSPLLSFSSLGRLAGTPNSKSFASAWQAATATEGGGPSELGPSAWWQRLGCFRGLSMRSVLQAAASGSQAALLTAALPHVAWDARDDERAAPDQGRAAFSTAAARSGRPELAWSLLRKLGAGLWLLDQTALTVKAEELARAQFARHKEPYECALLYLALGKKAVLLNLFKQASNRKLVDFLSRDFTQEASRVAAAKNAYALLGQHKYEMAAAFFLLGGSVREAVEVLAHERRDPQLALLIARLCEKGPGGPAGHRIITQDLMPLAQTCPDPAAVACCLWVDGKAAEAVQMLALQHGPSHGLQVNQEVMQTCSTRAADPGLLHFMLSDGIKQLAGRPVPRALTLGVCSLALESALALEKAGCAHLALQALLQALQLLQTPEQNTSGSQPGSGEKPAVAVAASGHQVLQRMYARLVAASVLHVCLAVAASGLPAALPRPGQLQGLIQAGPTPMLYNPLQPSTAQPPADITWMPVLDQASWLDQLQDWLLQPHLRLSLSSDDLAAFVRQSMYCLLPGGTYHLPVPVSLRYCCNPQAQIALQMQQSQSQVHASPSATTLLDPISMSAGGALIGDSHATAGARQHQQLSNIHLGLPAFAVAGAGSHISLASKGTISRTGSASSNVSGPLLASHGSVSGLRHTFSGSSLGFGSEAGTLPKNSLFVEPLEVLSVEGDRCASIICCSARGAAAMGRAKSDTRPVVAALNKAGLLSGEVELPSSCQAAALGPAPGDQASGSSWARQGSLFMGLLGQVLEHVRWTPDPWAAVTATHTGNPSHPSTPKQETGQSHAAQRTGSSMWTAGLNSPSTHLTANSSSTHTCALAAHPHRELFVSGSSGDHVFLWQFGDPCSKQVYVPLVDPAAAAANAAGIGRNAAGSGAASASSYLGPGYHPDPACTSSAAVAIATSAPPRKQLLLQVLASPHWDGAARLHYAAGGTRFVGVGAGGLVALWRQDMAPGAAGLGYAEWLHHCVPKKGYDILSYDDAGHQFIVCGKGDRGGVVSWWDTQAGPTSQCVAELRGRRAVPTCMQLMSSGSGSLLVVGDDAGELCAYDLRMLGKQLPVWSLSRAHPHGAACLSLTSWGPDQDPHGLVLARPTPLHIQSPPHGTATSPHAGTPSPAMHGSLSQAGLALGVDAVTLPARGNSQSSLVAVSTSTSLAGAVSTVALRNVVACGGKEGSIVLVDTTNGSVLQTMHRTHWQVKRNPLALLTGDRPPSTGGRPPPNSVGVPVTGLVSCEGGLLSCGADGVVRYHCLSVVAGRV